MPPELLYDPVRVDLGQVIADQEAIRKSNPQRFEMEQLTAIVWADAEQRLIVGYKDVGSDEFWCRGHLPGYPLFPGVLMCEAAAQLCSYYIVNYSELSGEFLGFGGMENVRFRAPVHPGSRLVLVGKCTRLHRRQTLFSVQGFVGSTMVFHADVLGVPMSRPPSASTAAEEQ